MTPAQQQTIAVKPIAVPSDERDVDLQVKVTAPRQGSDLPVIVFSHGNAWSMDGYEPLVDRWAAAGFVVVQPTHLDSRRHGIGFDDPRFQTIWRVRIADLHAVLDHLAHVVGEADLAERVDLSRVALVGHSWGAQTVGALLGARVLDPAGNITEDFSRDGITAGVLIAATGTGGSLTPFAQEHLSFMNPDYSTMTTPALVVAGDKDRSKMSTRGPDWFLDAYELSPSPKSLMVVPGGEHTLGGIAGEAVSETTDTEPARVALVADAVSAYLRAALDLDTAAWTSFGDGRGSPHGHTHAQGLIPADCAHRRPLRESGALNGPLVPVAPVAAHRRESCRAPGERVRRCRSPPTGDFTTLGLRGADSPETPPALALPGTRHAGGDRLPRHRWVPPHQIRRRSRLLAAPRCWPRTCPAARCCAGTSRTRLPCSAP
jgi:dienelactone hydrolase